jgi:hypothetical protein
MSGRRPRIPALLSSLAALAATLAAAAATRGRGPPRVPRETAVGADPPRWRLHVLRRLRVQLLGAKGESAEGSRLLPRGRRRLLLRQDVRTGYQPSSLFWRLQWYETAIHSALALGLSGFSLWRLRHHVP